MAATTLIVFDDAGGRWGPMTDLRPVFALRSGAQTTGERIERVLGKRVAAVVVPPALAALTAELLPGVPVNAWPHGPDPDASGRGGGEDGSCLLVNGRWDALEHADAVRALPAGAAAADAEGGIVAAHLTAAQAAAFRANGEWPDLTAMRVAELPGRPLLTRPWHLLERLEAALRADLAASPLRPWRSRAGVSIVRGYPIKVAPDARVHPMTVLNAEKGPIVIDRGAVVGSFSVVAGPCYIGERTIVGPHTHLRANTAVGPRCVVAGEISHSIVHGRSNKSHAGFLGHSLVGEWVNLGADTNVSNLKNTYGSVRMRLTAPAVGDERGGEGEDSGLGKLGPLIGDFVRTAIGSRLMTGSCLGTGTMLALSGFAPKFADRFAFYTDGSGGQAAVERYEMNKFLATAAKVMSRRGAALTPALEARLRALGQGEGAAVPRSADKQG